MAEETYSKEDMIPRMREALKGNFTRRDDKVTGRYVLSESERERYGARKETETRSRYLWEDLFVPEGAGGLKKKIGFFHSFDNQQGALEAFVLIPEEQGLARVERVVNGHYYENSGFLQPEYQEEAVKAIQDVASQHFAESGDIFQKRYVTDVVGALIPKDLKAFREEYRERMLQGLGNTDFDRNAEIEVLWANVTNGLCNLGFNSREPDFVKSVWEKSKTIPYGYLEGSYGAQVILAQALMQRDPKGMVEFDYVRNNLPTANLSHILATLPVRKTDVEMRPWQIQRGYPGKEVYEPIVDFMDKTLSE